MANYQVTVKTPGAIAGGAAAATIRSAASGQGALPAFNKLTIVNHANPATSTVVDVYKVPLANCGTATASVVGQPVGSVSSPTSGVNVDTAWSSLPTLPNNAVPVDGVTLSGAIGQGQVLTFPKGMTIEPGTGLLLWCPTASSQLRITPNWDE